MAFEQSQKTRVESKQYSGDWSGFIAPQGNGGHATEPYYKPSQGVDFTPLANGINKVADDYDKGRGRRGGSGDEDGGEFINRAYDIVELNTDSNGVLSARGEEQIRHLRRQMGQAGYTDSKIQTVLSAVGQDYKSTTQGMMQEAQRKHVVDEEKDLAKKGVELYPELTGRTLAEQAEAGRNYYKNMNLLSAALEAASNPNSSKSIHDAAISEAADTFLSLIGSDKLNKVLSGEVNADDQLELANQITNSLIQGGVTTNIREARALGVELSASFVGKSRENRAAMEKLTVEEKDRYIELKKNEARTGLYKTDPTLATKLALVNWDLTKLPEEYLTFLTDFDASKIGGNGTEHYWQGAFDARTANICVQNGTPCVADAGQHAINEQGLNNGDADSANQVLQSMMSENMRGLLNRSEMAAQRPAAVQAYKEQLAGLLVNELRPHVLPKTSYVPSENRAGDVGFWNTADKINPIMNKWKDAMRYIGMSDEEIVETGKNAMSALGVAIPDNTTNPESFYQDSVRNIEKWMLENPVKRNIPFLDKSGESYVGISRALNDYRDGKITEEEAIAQMGASMNELNRDLDDGGIVNPGSVADAETKQLDKGTINISAIENDVLSSKEYKDAVEAISQDVTMSANEKSQAAASKFSELVQRFTDAAKEIALSKTAQARPAYADINSGLVTGEVTPEGYHTIKDDFQPAFIKNVNKQPTKKIVDKGGRSNEKLVNLVARVIFEEARSEGDMGMYLVATAMWNRTKAKTEKDKGDPSRLADVIRKKSAFEPVSKDPYFYTKENKRLFAPPKRTADQKAWDYCMQLASAMVNDNFEPAGNFTGFLNESIAKNKGSDFQKEKEKTQDLEVYKYKNHLFYKQPSYLRYSGFRQTGT